MVVPHIEIVRQRYLHALLARYGTLTLPLSSQSKDIPLEAVFQPLALRSRWLSPLENEPEHAEKLSENNMYQLQEQLVQAQHGAEALEKSPSRRLIILGGPGMGKTTLLKDLLQQAARRALADVLAPLPLFISLPDLARSGLALADYVPHLLAELEIDADFATVVQIALTSGLALLCLDSLDEVLPQQRPDLIAFINRAALQCGGTWIIGSRFTEYQGGQFSRSAFVEWELLPLDSVLRRQLAAHLLPLLSELLQKPSSSTDAFLQALSDDRRIAEWGDNPLLFSLAAVVYVQLGFLPIHRAALYSTIIDVMLGLRIADPVQRQDLRQKLAHVALDFYATKGRNFALQDLQTFFECSENTTQEVYTHIASFLNSGLLDVVAYQTYGFKHQMFQEYLAAVALAQQMVHPDEQIAQAAWEFVWRKRTYSRWREILRLLVGVLVQEYSEEGSHTAAHWLQRLASEHTTADGDPGHLCLVLALSSLQEFPVVNRSQHMTQAVRSLVLVWAEVLCKTLVQGDWGYNYRSNWENSSSTEFARIFDRLEQLLEYIQLLDLSLVLPALDYLEQAFEQAKANDVERGMEVKFEELIHSLTRSIPARVLALAFPEPEQINLYTVVQAKKLDVVLAEDALLTLVEDAQEPWQARIGAVRLLAKVEKPSVRATLLRMLTDSTCSSRVRIGMAEALGEQGGAPVAQALVQAAQGASERLRLAAIRAMGQLGMDIPVPALLIALSDEVQDIRQAAIEALGKLDEQADLEPLLAALHVGDALVRFGVLEALGTIHARTLRVSIETAIEFLHDPDYSVRLAVVHLLGKIVDVRALPLLLEALCDVTPEPENSQTINDAAIGSLHDLSEKLSDVQQWITEEEIVQAFQDKRINHYRLLDLAMTLHLRLPPELILADFTQSSMYALKQKVHFLNLLGVDAPISALLDMLQASSLETQENAAHALLSLYRHVPAEPIMAWFQRADITSEVHNVVTRGNLLEIAVDLLELLVRQGREIDTTLIVCLLDNASTSTNIKEGTQRLCHLLQEKTPIAQIFGLLCDAKAPETCIGILRDLYEFVTPEMILTEAAHRRDDEVAAIQVLKGLQAEAPVDLLWSIFLDNSKDKLVRVHALFALHDLGVVIPLEYYVLGQDWCFYGAEDDMVEAMTRLGAQAPFSELVQLLGYDNEWVRSSAEYSLKNLAEYVPIELLLPALESDIGEMRVKATSVLSAFGSRAPVEKLLDMVRDERVYLRARASALEALNSVGYHVPVDLLLSLLEIDNYNLRGVVFDAFATLGKDAPLDVLLELLKRDEFRIGVIDVLGSMAENAPIDLLLALFDGEDDQYHAAQALAKLGKYAPIEEMCARLYNTDGEICEDIIEALGDMDEYTPIDILLQALDNDDYEIRNTADTALFWLAEQTPARLVAEACHDQRPVVRKQVLKAVAKLGSDAPIEIALAALDVKETRKDALRTLAELDIDVSARVPLDFLLQQWDEEAEADATHWAELTLLTHYGAQVPVEFLLAQFGSHSLDTYAVSALCKTHPDVFREVVAPQAEAILRGEPTGGVFAVRVQRRIAATLGQIGRVTPVVLQMVVELLDAPDRGTCLEAIRALGAIHRNIPDRAIRRLMELRHEQSAPVVRRAADAALAEILSYEQGMEDE